MIINDGSCGNVGMIEKLKDLWKSEFKIGMPNGEHYNQWEYEDPGILEFLTNRNTP